MPPRWRLRSAASERRCSPQQGPAAQLLEQVATAMGGRERLQRIDTLVYTGFGQDAYMDGGGNITAEVNVPPKWRAIADAQRSFDLKAGRALLQQRRAPMFPFAAPFGLNWNRVSTLQSRAETLDHPLPAVRAALDPAARLGAVSVEDGLPVLQFTTAEGTPMLMGSIRRPICPPGLAASCRMRIWAMWPSPRTSPAMCRTTA